MIIAAETNEPAIIQIWTKRLSRGPWGWNRVLFFYVIPVVLFLLLATFGLLLVDKNDLFSQRIFRSSVNANVIYL